MDFLQDDTLAPYLFVISLNYIMRKTYDGREEEQGFQLNRRRCRRNLAKTIADFDFVDDIAVITEDICQAHEVLTRLEQEAEVIGLHCNAKKKEMQIINLDTSAINTD